MSRRESAAARSSVGDPQVTRGGNSSNFRSDIEGLRGIAVLIVVAFHCAVPGFGGGFVGVDVFFALSGYLITGLLLREVESTSRIGLLNFYARRARRLLPASALVLLFTLIMSALILAPQELLFAGRAAQATALYLSNVFFAINAADYFSPSVETNPMLHTWSLAVEEQFYLLWPFLIVLTVQLWKSRRALVAVLAALTVASLACCIWLTYRGVTEAFYELPARAWEFGAGGLAASIPVVALRRAPRTWLALGIIGLATVVGSAHFISAADRFPGWVAALPVCGTIAVLLAGTASKHAVSEADISARALGVAIVLDTAPLQLLGKLSYSWYLWHWPLLVFAVALVPDISIAGRCMAAGVALILAAMAYRWVESPVRFHPRLRKRPVLTLGLAAVLTVCTVATSIGFKRLAGTLANAPQMRLVTAATTDIARMPRAQCVSLGESSEIKPCIFAASGSSTTIVLFGDSHAIQWMDPLQIIASAHQWKLVSIVKSGCPAADITVPAAGDAFRTACKTWRAAALRKITALHPALVILASATIYLDDSRRNGGHPTSPMMWREGSKRTIGTLDDAGIEVAVMRDTPRPEVDIPTCLGRVVTHRWYPRAACNLNRASALRPAAFNAELAAAEGRTRVHFLDLTDEICDSVYCPAVKNDRIVYRDDNHLTGSFAASLAPALEARLTPLVPPLSQQAPR